VKIVIDQKRNKFMTTQLHSI